jgi:hypothetical protein
MRGVFKGWRQCYYHFLAWRWLLEGPYNAFVTWEFFSYMNNEIQDTFTYYISADDYKEFLELIENPAPLAPALTKLLTRKTPWKTDR